MKKIVSAFAVIAASAAATIGLLAGTAGAHTATLGYDCFTVTAHYVDFGAGTHAATITINGTVHDVSFTGSSGDASVPFVSHSGDPDVVVSTTFISGDDKPKTISATFPADSCAPPPTTAPPSTTRPTTPTIPIQVGPETVVRPTVVAASPVVASPTFTG
jgi:hypothetical protein